MDKRTTDALKKSIAHWEENVAADTPEQARVLGNACALCELFATPRNDGGPCDGCPVAERSGMMFCDGTPWEAAYYALHAWECRPSDMSQRARWRIRAQAELDFLISLRDVAP